MTFLKTDWDNVSSTSLSDAMHGLQTMDSCIQPLNRRMCVAGPAFTVQIVQNDCAVVFQALRDAAPGSVLVIAANGTTDVAFFGEIVVAIAKEKGLAGIVIDGCARDSLALSQNDFPVFVKGIVPRILARVFLGEVQKDVQCGGVLVRPGDIVFGDADGVVIIPQEQQAPVLAKAQAKEKLDQWKMEHLLHDPEALEKFLTDTCTP